MANEKRLIDANALKIKAWPEEMSGEGVVYVEDIDSAPTVDAVEVVHGEWEPHPKVRGFVRCSACRDCNTYDDWPDGKKWKYCPHCGAKMDGGK